jgi:CHAP domain
VEHAAGTTALPLFDSFLEKILAVRMGVRDMARSRVAWALVPAALLAACAAPPRAMPPPALATGTVTGAQIVPVTPGLECVAYARRESAIEIFGDAWTWWDGARGRYPRGATPQPGAVLVFKRHNGSRGHLAVVRRLAGARVILVDHADWLNDGNIHLATPVADVSPAGDWSELRVWYSPGATWGRRVYGAYGFIYPARPVAATLPGNSTGG